MANYELHFTVPSPGGHKTFVDFSPTGRFLVVGEQDSSSLHILDRRAGFHPTLSASTRAKPTAVVWETYATFYVGLSNGEFVHYRIDLGDKKLVEGISNHHFRGAFPITAMAIDAESKRMVLSVGPGIYALRRFRATSEFRFTADLSRRFAFRSDPGSPAPPFPKTICFTQNNTLVVTFCRQNIASVVLESAGNSGLCSSFQTERIDYSGLPLLKAITSANEEEINSLTHCWIHGNAFRPGEDAHPFLFINGGAATLSSTALGTAVIRDTVTQREIQQLKHTGVYGQRIAAMAYHVSNERYSIATADYGADATIKIWTLGRAPSRPQGQSYRVFLTRKGWIFVALLAVPVVAMQREMERTPSAGEVLYFFSQMALIAMKLCIYFGYTILETAEGVVLALAHAAG